MSFGVWGWGCHPADLSTPQTGENILMGWIGILSLNLFSLFNRQIVSITAIKPPNTDISKLKMWLNSFQIMFSALVYLISLAYLLISSAVQSALANFGINFESEKENIKAVAISWGDNFWLFGVRVLVLIFIWQAYKICFSPVNRVKVSWSFENSFVCIKTAA